MTQLLAAQDWLKQFYGKYSIYIDPVIRFLIGFLAFLMINNNIGFMERLKTPVIPVIMGLIASFMPYGVTAFLAGCFAVAHISEVSLEAAIILFVIILIVMLLYYSLKPGDGYLLLLTPMVFFLDIPYVVPLIVGLSGSIISIVPVSCGVCVYYILDFVKENALALDGGSLAEITERFPAIFEAIFTDRLMWVMIAALSISLLAVFIIKNLSIDYAWLIATGVGVAVELAVLIVGASMFDIQLSVGSMALGILISIVIALIYQVFVFTVDYSRTQYLEYEDDDYVYYVKAVPKIVFDEEPEEEFDENRSTRPKRRSGEED